MAARIADQRHQVHGQPHVAAVGKAAHGSGDQVQGERGRAEHEQPIAALADSTPTATRQISVVPMLPNCRRRPARPAAARRGPAPAMPSRLRSESRGGKVSSHMRPITSNSAPAWAPGGKPVPGQKTAGQHQVIRGPDPPAAPRPRAQQHGRHGQAHAAGNENRRVRQAQGQRHDGRQAHSQRVSSGCRHQRTASKSKSVETIRSTP